jgi:Ca-activated chloride channel family protein
MLLNGAKRAQYDKLVAYFRSKDFQTRMSAVTLRRPVNPDATMASAIPKRRLVELPFPGQPSLINALLDNFVSEIRVPATSRYVLDLSGSMRGERIAGLKEAMLMLASNSPASAQRYAKFQNREEVGVITFSDEPDPTRVFLMGSTPEQNAHAREELSRFVDSLHAGGATAIYSSVRQAVMEMAAERSRAREKRYYTVVLMTDGQNNRGMGGQEFRHWYDAEGDRVRGIRVFPILFGEGDKQDLSRIAEMTGGRLFDSKSSSLATVFKEIRGYQ